MSADAAFVVPRAQDDFNGFINGEWESKNTIPDDQTRWGAFMILREDNFQRGKEICEANPDSLVGQLYALASNVPEKVPEAITNLMTKTEKEIVDTASYQRAAARLLTEGVSLFAHMCKSEDSKDPTIRVPHVFQAGLGLPDMSFYTDRTDLFDDYKAYITNVTKLLGFEVDAEKILEFEKQIAEKHLTRVQRRDTDLTYNKRDFGSELPATLRGYFDAIPLFGVSLNTTIVDNPKLLEFLGEFLTSTDATTLRQHALFKIADHFAPMATQEAVDLHFDFRGKKLSGQKVIDPLWKRARQQVESMIGDELGKLYVEKHFPAEKQKRCNEMVLDLKDSLRETISELEWMSPDTKTQALAKLEAFGVKIGVPEQWHSIEGLWPNGLKGLSLAEASLQWAAWDWECEEVKKFYSAPEKDLWHMTPQTVNAYYHPKMNEIVFPAGILQPPFFGYDEYEQNIGAIGVVIGHEMTHGFDDQGRKYNAKGELVDWWTESDAKSFDERAKPVRDHYGAQEILGKPVNGDLTLGENIADIGGLKLALRAAKKKFGGNLSKEQYTRFFTAYAMIWRMLIRDEMALKLLSIDPHSPTSLRINCALGHIKEFYDTFDVKEGDKMFLAETARMNIW